MSFVPSKAKAKKQMGQTGRFVLSFLLKSFKLYLDAVCRTDNENTSTETQIWTDIGYRRAHTPTLEYDE